MQIEGRMLWSAEEVETLKRLIGEGLTAAEISERFCGRVSRSGVLGKVHRLGLTMAGLPGCPPGSKQKKSREKVKPESPPATDQRQSPAFRTDLPAPKPEPIRKPPVVRPAPPAPAPRPPVVLRDQSWPDHAIKIHQLELDSCRWIYGDRFPRIRYCGQPQAHRSFCAAHALRAFDPKHMPVRLHRRLKAEAC